MSWDTITFDPDGDWAIFDGVETITFRPFVVDDGSGGDSYDDTISVAALYREIDDSNNSIAQGETTVSKVVIHLRASQLRSIHRPVRLDQIIRDPSTGDSVTYVVQTVKEQSLGSRYRCEVTKAV